MKFFFFLVMSLENAFILQNDNNNSFSQQQKKILILNSNRKKKIPIQGLNACTSQQTDTKIFVFFNLNLNNQSHSDRKSVV